jgi:nucleoside-diphosphate-sugar epimerase
VPSVLITGARGFIGAALARRYRAEGWEVRGVDVVAEPAAAIVAGDVGARGPWQDAAAGCDLVVHTAAVVSMRVTGRDEVRRVNVEGTRNALEAAERTGARLVHLSTVVVFGMAFPDGVDERHPVALTGLPYGDTKVAAEHLVLQAHAEGRAEVVVVRPGDVYGPGSRAWAVIPFERIAARRLVLPARGRGVFSPVHVDDLVEGIVLAGREPAAAGQVITLSGGIGVPTREFFAPYAELAGRPLPAVPTPLAVGLTTALAPLRLDDELTPFAARYLSRRGTYSIAKARRLLGWEPRVALADGLRETVEWLRVTRP